MVASGGKPFELSLFGPLRVVRAGQQLKPPPGLASMAVVLLALHGGEMHRDALIERLWWEVPVQSGRHRLRNVLSDVRASTGAEVERQGDAVVWRDPLWCDIDEFIRVATTAVIGFGDETERRRAGLRAQDLWRGSPLEAWRFDPWAISVRRQLFALRQQLWDLLPSVSITGKPPSRLTSPGPVPSAY